MATLEAWAPERPGRRYRRLVSHGRGVSFEAVVGETDLFIRADRPLREQALASILRHRAQLEGYLVAHPAFGTSLTPCPVEDTAPALVAAMAEAGRRAGVGPMAAVAGALADAVGRDLLHFSRRMVVENGGDLFVASPDPCIVALGAPASPLSGRIGLRVRPDQMPLGIATSAGTAGHSLSLGRADAACVVARSSALADAYATAVGNRVRVPGDINAAVRFCQEAPGLLGVVLVLGERLGAWGQIELVEL